MKLLVNIDVPDAHAAAAFYEKALGWRRGRTLDGDVVEMLGASSAVFLLQKPRDELRHYDRHWTPVHLDIVVDDLDASRDRAIAAGAKQESACVEWKGSRCITFADPFGHGFCLIAFDRGGTYSE